VTYTHLNVDDFTEEGAPGADLHVDSTNAESLRSRLGGHAIYTAMAGDVIFQPNLSVLWQHEAMAGSAQTITSNFSDFASNPFTIQTIAPGRDSALVTLGVDVTLTNSMALYFDYLADVGSSTYYAQSIVGGFKAHF
jgi:outer membrane autotransporter protein